MLEAMKVSTIGLPIYGSTRELPSIITTCLLKYKT